MQLLPPWAGNQNGQEAGVVSPQRQPGWMSSVFWKGSLGWGNSGEGGSCPWPLKLGLVLHSSSAWAKRWAALGAVAHQALVGFEARQGLAAGDGGQRAAEAQHGGRGVLPWGERAGEAWPTWLCVCQLRGVDSEGAGHPQETLLEHLSFSTKP